MEDENFFEEEIGNKDFNGNNKIFKIFILLVILGVLGFGIYVTYLKLNEKEDIKEEKEIKEEKVIEGVSLECMDECTYSLFDGETLKYTVTMDDYSHHKLSLNDKVLLEKDFSCGGPDLLTVLDDIFIISYNDNCTTGGNYIAIYNKMGEEIRKYNYMDDNYNMWIESTTYEVKGKSIFIKANRLYKEHVLRLSKKDEVNLCEKDEYSLYNITTSTPINGTYSLKYLGNNSFDDLEFIPNKLVKDDILTCEE